MTIKQFLSYSLLIVMTIYCVTLVSYTSVALAMTDDTAFMAEMNEFLRPPDELDLNLDPANTSITIVDSTSTPPIHPKIKPEKSVSSPAPITLLGTTHTEPENPEVALARPDENLQQYTPDPKLSRQDNNNRKNNTPLNGWGETIGIVLFLAILGLATATFLKKTGSPSHKTGITPQTQQKKEGTYCANCGSKLQSETTFCTGCGQKT